MKRGMTIALGAAAGCVMISTLWLAPRVLAFGADTPIIVRDGSFWMARRVSRALRIPCAWYGFVPTKRTTSACSTSSVTWQRWSPKSRPFTQKSPVFSWASAL